MPDRPWKAEERQVARLLGGRRHFANSGGPVDVESDRFVCQVKHLKTCSLSRLEALSLELEAIGTQRGKIGLVCIKRRAGRGHDTVRLLILAEPSWKAVMGTTNSEVGESA